MRTIQFNFNNEANIVTLEQNKETGVITIPGQDLTFESVEEFAEFYAVARNVAPDKLKNWILTSHGDVYTYALRAATAGIDANDIRKELNRSIETAAANLGAHPLDVGAFRNCVVGASDVVEALVNCANKEMAKAVYDILAEAGHLDEPEVDTRSDIEIVMDEAFEDIGTYALFAKALNIDVNSSKEEILARIDLVGLETDTFLDMFKNMARSEMERAGIPSDRVDLFAALVAQGPVGNTDENVVNRLVAAAAFAGRDSININTVKIGTRHVKDTAVFTPIKDLEDLDVRVLRDVPTIFIVDADIDEVVERELQEAHEARLAAEAEAEEYDDYDEYDEYDDEDDYDW